MRQKPSLRRALQVAVFNTVIAASITVFMQGGFWVNLVYSQCIGLIIWALVEAGQYWLITDLQRQWRRLFWLAPLCAALGYGLGTALAQQFYPTHSLATWARYGHQSAGFLVISLLAGAASSYFFMSREQLAQTRADVARTQAQAEAAQRLAAQAQLALLQSQLEPHMLFNTLANLRALMALDPQRAQEMLDHLVAYLRATLNASRQTWHPLQTEFERLRDYLELIKVRMGPRLHYALDLPEALAGINVPPLLLQPLVENAIKHGLEPQRDGGQVWVSAQRNGAELTLEVRDNGAGLGADRDADAPTHEGFGLAQVRERLKTVYGPEATIELVAGSAGGVRARAVFLI